MNRSMSIVHCKFLPHENRAPDIAGYLQVFPALSMEKDYKNHKETLCINVVGKPL